MKKLMTIFILMASILGILFAENVYAANSTKKKSFQMKLRAN